MKDVEDIPTGNVLSSLQGRVAGMNITTDGTPGGGNTSTLVRGKSSFRNDANSPLYVIDGVMTRENISSILSSNDVESIQVLKDAASASIYGAQAANGVIIITTKRAKKGETRVDFDMSLTLQTYQCGFDMLNADEWGQVYWSAYKYANNGATPSSEIYGNGATPQLQDYIGLNGAKVHAVDTDWRDVVYRTALMQNYSATLSKGSDNGAFSLALNYLDHDGLVENTNFQRINTRISSNYHYLDLIACPCRLKSFVGFIIIIHTEIGFQHQVLNRFNFKECITKDTPIIMFVLFFILQQTCHIGGITQNIIDGIVIITILIINRLGRMLFDGILIYTGRTEGLCPTIDGNVLADAQAMRSIS